MTAYDVWSEFDPDTAQALRSAIHTGDWSVFDPEVVDAFRRANDGDWSAFDPQMAVTIRAAIGQEQMAAEARNSQERIAADAKADRDLAVEMRQLGAKYSDFNANAETILNFAVRGNLGDLDLAYKTWRSTNGHDGPALAGQEPTDPTADRLREIDKRLGELKYKDYREKESELRDLKRERDDLWDKQVIATVRAENDPDQERRDLIHEANFERATHNAQKAFAREHGHSDTSRARKPRAELDLEAMDLVSGRTQPPKAQRNSNADREAERLNFDAIDHKAYARLHGEISESEAADAPPNAEAVMQEITG